MNTRQDILLDHNNDLLIQNGDFVIGSSDVQHVDFILNSQPGEWKEFPQVGFGVKSYLKGVENTLKFKRNLRIQLSFDGYVNPKIDLSKGYSNLEIKI